MLTYLAPRAPSLMHPSLHQGSSLILPSLCFTSKLLSKLRPRLLAIKTQKNPPQSASTIRLHNNTLLSAFHSSTQHSSRPPSTVSCTPHNMQPSHSSQTWAGALRLAPLIVATILLFSIITLGLATAYGKQMAHAPLDPYKTLYPSAYPYAHRWSNA